MVCIENSAREEALQLKFRIKGQRLEKVPVSYYGFGRSLRPQKRMKQEMSPLLPGFIRTDQHINLCSSLKHAPSQTTLSH